MQEKYNVVLSGKHPAADTHQVAQKLRSQGCRRGFSMDREWGRAGSSHLWRDPGRGYQWSGADADEIQPTGGDAQSSDPGAGEQNPGLYARDRAGFFYGCIGEVILVETEG